MFLPVTKLLTMAMILLLFLPAATRAKEKKSKKISAQAAAKKKLQTIRVTGVKFEKESLSKVLKTLADQSKAGDPDSKGFAFILPMQPVKITAGFGKPKRLEEPKITLQLADSSLGGAIDKVCKQAKLRWTLMPGKIIVRPEKSSADNGRNKATLAVQKKLKAIIIPRVSFEDTPMPEALDYIAKQTKKIDVASEGVDFHLHYYPNMVISANRDLMPRQPAEKKLSLDFDDLPLGDTLRYIGRMTKLTVRVAGDGVHIYR